jgi:hypothetical protein
VLDGHADPLEALRREADRFRFRDRQFLRRRHRDSGGENAE